MADVLVDENALSGIADAIREKTGGTATYKPREMADAISKISGSKFGLTLDSFIGDLDDDGTLSMPSTVDLSLTGVKKIKSGPPFWTKCAKSFQAPDLVEVSGGYCMKNAFASSDSLKTAAFPQLVKVSGYQAFNATFRGCGSLTAVGFPLLESVSGGSCFSYVCYNEGVLTGADFPKLKTVSGDQVFSYAFAYSGRFKSVGFPLLETIDCDSSSLNNGRQFYFAFAPSSSSYQLAVSFPSLKEIYANGSSTSYAPFGTCGAITRLDLPKLAKIGTHYTGTSAVSDVAIKNMFYGCFSLKEIHFGSANQAAVEAMPGYDTLWGLGAGKATIYFDL